jgi:hypothetical protein
VVKGVYPAVRRKYELNSMKSRKMAVHVQECEIKSTNNEPVVGNILEKSVITFGHLSRSKIQTGRIVSAHVM